eukprot:467415-Hanusia_phi.AAC.1
MSEKERGGRRKCEDKGCQACEESLGERASHGGLRLSRGVIQAFADTYYARNFYRILCLSVRRL